MFRADLDVKDREGNTLTLWALKNNKLELVKYLAPLVDIRLMDNFGQNLAKIAR